MNKRFVTSIILLFFLLIIFSTENIKNYFDEYRTQKSLAQYKVFLQTPFDEVFANYYSEQLDSAKIKRAEAFAKIFDLLKKQRNKPITIVETGSIRKPYFRLGGDSSSTLLFNHFVKYAGGVVYTVDLDPRCKEIIDDIYKLKYVHSNIMDSVEYLKQFKNPQDISLLYLDSYDINFKKPENSAKHHLKEIEAIFDKLSPGTIIAIDDNKIVDGKNMGKGYLVEEFLKNKNVSLIYDGYVKIFQIESQK
jgi:hypothetical protein